MVVVVLAWVRALFREYSNDDDTPVALEITNEVDIKEMYSIFFRTGAITQHGSARSKKYVVDEGKIKLPSPKNAKAEHFHLWFTTVLCASRRIYASEALEYKEDPETEERQPKREREAADTGRQAEEQERERQQDKERVEQMRSTLSQLERKVTVLLERVPTPQTDQQKRESAEKDRRIQELQQKLREAVATTAVKPVSKKDKQEPDEKDRAIKDLEKKLAEAEAAAIRAAAAGGAQHFVVRGGGAHGGLGPVVDGAVTTTKKKDQAQERPSFFSELSDQFAWWMGTASSVLGGEPAAKKHKGGDGAP